MLTTAATPRQRRRHRRRERGLYNSGRPLMVRGAAGAETKQEPTDRSETRNGSAANYDLIRLFVCLSVELRQLLDTRLMMRRPRPPTSLAAWPA